MCTEPNPLNRSVPIHSQAIGATPVSPPRCRVDPRPSNSNFRSVEGDLRRTIEKGGELLHWPISEFMNRQPKRILRTHLAGKALQRAEEYAITSLFVFDSDASRRPVGVIRLHDLLRAGVV